MAGDWAIPYVTIRTGQNKFVQKATSKAISEVQRTVAGENSVVPVQYGLGRRGPLICGVMTAPNGWLWLVCVWCEGPINAVAKLEVNDEAMPGLGLAEVHNYLGTEPAIQYTGADLTHYNALKTVLSQQSPAILNFADQFEDIAWSIIKFSPYAQVSGFPEVTATLEGMKVARPSQAFVVLDGTDDAATTPDSAKVRVNEDFTLEACLTMPDWSPAAEGYPLSKWTTATNNRGWLLVFQTNGRPMLSITTAGTSGTRVDYAATAAFPFANGATGWVRVVYRKDAGGGNSSATFYTSTDGIAWTQLGAVVTQAVVATIFGSTAPVRAGGTSTPSYTACTVHYATMRTPTKVCWEFLPWEAEAGATTWEAPSGEVWTLAGGAVVNPAMVAYSTNPTAVLADFCRSTHYGEGKRVDWRHALRCEALNDTQVTGPGGTHHLHQIDLALDQPQEVQTWRNVLRDYAHCWVSEEDGVLFFVRDSDDGIAMAFDATNIAARSLAWSKRGILQQATVVQVDYTEIQGTIWRTEKHIERLPGVLAGAIPRRPVPYSKPGITRHAEAVRYAIERLNESTLSDVSIRFQAFDEAAVLREGDLITVTHPGPGFAAKPFRVKQIRMTLPGRYQIDADEFDPALYSDSVVTAPTIVDTNLPVPSAPPAITGLAMVEEYYQEASHRKWTTRFRATWDAPAWTVQFDYAVRLVKIVDGVEEVFWEDIKGDALYVSGAVQEGHQYRVEVAVRGPYGHGPTAMFTALALGNQMPPSDVVGLTGTEAGGQIYLRWQPAADLSTLRYEIREGSLASTWDTANRVDRVDTLTFLTQGFPAGWRRLFVKALDSLGLYSVNAAYVDVQVLTDDSAFKAIEFAPSGWSSVAVSRYTQDSVVYGVTDFGDPVNFGHSTVDNASGTFNDSGAVAPTIAHAYGCVMDYDTGAVVWGKSETTPVSIASTTKTMTLLLLLENVSDLNAVSLTFASGLDPGGTTADLDNGVSYTLHECAMGMCLPSGNDAAEAIAKYVGDLLGGVGGQTRFYAEMNAKAATLGMTGTFYNAAGYPWVTGHTFSAEDMCKLMRALLQFDATRACTYLGAHSYWMNKSGTSADELWDNTGVQGLVYGGAIATKTGSLSSGGGQTYTIANAVERGGKRFIAFLRDTSSTVAQSRDEDLRKMFDYAYALANVTASSTYEIHDSEAGTNWLDIVTLTGTWLRSAELPANYYGSFGYYTNNTGGAATERLAFTFYGNNIKFYTSTSAVRGKADIYINGVLDATIDMYSASVVFSTLLHEKTLPDMGPHTWEIRARADKNASSTGYMVSFDRVVITEALPPSGSSGTPSSVSMAMPHSSAPLFNGVDSYITIPNAAGLNAGTTFSLDARIYVRATPSAGVIYSNTDGAGGAVANEWALAVSQTRVLHITNVVTFNIVVGPQLELGRWYHVAVTYNNGSSNWKLYLDGVDVTGTIVTPTAISADTSNAKTIGRTNKNGAGGYFNGLIKSVRWWNSVLSPAEVLKAMEYRGLDAPAVVNAGGITTANLLGCWNLDDGVQASGVTVCDDARNVSDGTLINGEWRSWDEVVSEPIDMGAVYSATFEVTKLPVAISGTARTSILLATSPGGPYYEQPGTTVAGNARYVKIKQQAEGGAALYDLTNTAVRVSLTPRSEMRTIQTFATASVPAIVELAGSYAQALKIQLTPRLYNGGPSQAVYDQVEVSGGRGLRQGRSLRFAGLGGTGGGAHSYVSVGNHAQFDFHNGSNDLPFTLECLTKFDVVNAVQSFVGKGSGGPTGQYQLRIRVDGKFSLLLVDTTVGAIVHVSTTLAFAPGVWYHVAATYAGSNPKTGGVKLYVNGKEEPTTITESGGAYVRMRNSSDHLVIGNQYNGGLYNSPVTGVLDEVRVWNVVRTPAQIVDNIAQYVAGNAAGLVGYWKLDETSGFTATDSQTNTTQRNGTLGNGSTFNGLASVTQKWWRPYDGFDVYCFSSSTPIANEVQAEWTGA